MGALRLRATHAVRGKRAAGVVDKAQLLRVVGGNVRPGGLLLDLATHAAARNSVNRPPAGDTERTSPIWNKLRS